MNAKAESGPPPRRTSVAFGVVSSAADVRERLRIVCEDIARQTGLVVYPHTVTTYAKLSQEVRSGKIEVAWAPPLLALDLQASGIASVVACAERERGTKYHAAIFAPRNAGFRTINDLRGRHMAWVAPESTSGYLVPRLWIQSSGIEPETFFGRETFFHTHDGVVNAVLRGAADAGATHAALDPGNGHVLDAGWIARLRADPGAVSVVATAGPIPTDTIVIAKRISAEASSALVQALVAPSGPALTAMQALFAAKALRRADATHLSPLLRLRARRSGSFRL